MQQHFTDKPDLKYRHHSSSIILAWILLFGMGTSPNSIALVINQTHNMHLYDSTVQRWADHYVALVEKYAKILRPRVGRVWSCDEKFIIVSGATYW